MKLLSSSFLFLALIGPFCLSCQPYFQQEVNYTIDVKLDDINHELQATETIEYVNNSPNTLTFIYMHLWPNAYVNNSTPLAKQLYNKGETKLYFATDD
ncbi:MAG TPA: hypothetical protein VLB84_17300, partial [Bacteroidia bacterium]|nr:hypothetical protein [Bacteroidia bacterium]